MGVKSDGWAAAAGLPAGCFYLELSILRGGLQGIGDYKGVGLSLIGEQGSRLVLGAMLAIFGMGVTGAYLGSLLSYVAMSAYCWRLLRAQLAGVPGDRRAPFSAIGLGRHVSGSLGRDRRSGGDPAASEHRPDHRQAPVRQQDLPAHTRSPRSRPRC